MSTWTSDELNQIGAAEELRVAPMRRDGSLRKPVTIWVVRHGDDLYVRSVNGSAGAWYRGSQARHQGHISAGGVEKNVSFEDADGDLDDRIDAEYAAKYKRYAADIIDTIKTPKARATTIRLVPRSASE
jgi:hypothetical protein